MQRGIPTPSCSPGRNGKVRTTIMWDEDGVGVAVGVSNGSVRRRICVNRRRRRRRQKGPIWILGTPCHGEAEPVAFEHGSAHSWLQVNTEHVERHRMHTYMRRRRRRRNSGRHQRHRTCWWCATARCKFFCCCSWLQWVWWRSGCDTARRWHKPRCLQHLSRKWGVARAHIQHQEGRRQDAFPSSS